MKVHNPELLSALLDGELHGLRRRRVERHLRRCALCAAEYRRLHHVRELLAGNPPTAQMSDSPQFFWSKVKRQIEAESETRSSRTLQLFGLVSRHVYATATAVVAVTAMLGVFWMTRMHRPSPAPPLSTNVLVVRGSAVTVERVATVLNHTVATPLQADDTSVAVIWVSGLPWMPDMTTMKTRFATLDS